ncbi:MAG: ATP-dependent Clp protease proteolytic subunit, partial [Defluviitaleaceae bacterium]|nr:ATP-dependent Clp protease proteolytic subunit [Defluviitaleaceae bacterium]
IMIHQPSGGARGMASDIQIQAEHILRMKRKLNEILSKQTGQSVSRIEADSDRDKWMSADEALSYGLIDKIITRRENNAI